MQSGRSRWRIRSVESSHERNSGAGRERCAGLLHVLRLSHADFCCRDSCHSLLEFNRPPDSNDLSMPQLLAGRYRRNEIGAPVGRRGRDSELPRVSGTAAVHQRCGDTSRLTSGRGTGNSSGDSRRNSGRASEIRSIVGSRAAAILIGLLWLTSSRLGAQQVTVLPGRPAPGSIIRITLNEGSVAAVRGELGGEPLHFREIEPGQWRAIGGVPVDATGKLVGHVIAERASGGIDSLEVSVTLPVPRPGRGRPRRLSVAPRFTRPLDSATEARVARENARAREVGRRAHETPRMWTGSFLRPRSSSITARFGSGRTFNRTLASRHLGVDFAGNVGAPVRAANRGVVALVDNFFLAGNVVYIDHGDGVVTGYFHLSRALVAEGDTVARGQEIGRVGATGRVTGPHLHWSARYGALTVNPIDLLTLSGW